MRTRRLQAIRAATLLAALSTATLPAAAGAQEAFVGSATQIKARLATQPVASVRIRDWPLLVFSERTDLPSAPLVTSGPAAQSSRLHGPSQPRKYNVAQRILASAGMGVAGFFVGGYVGAKLEPPCGCDDPGLQGFIIGAPIGAVAGAIFGAWLTR